MGIDGGGFLFEPFIFLPIVFLPSFFVVGRIRQSTKRRFIDFLVLSGLLILFLPALLYELISLACLIGGDCP